MTSLESPDAQEARPTGRSWRTIVARTARVLSILGGVCFVGATAVYQEPKSFYTNFVLFPSLTLMAVGAPLDLLAIVLALPGLRGQTQKMARVTLAIAVLVPVLAIATIQLILRR